jgi:hypothetical protein
MTKPKTQTTASKTPIHLPQALQDLLRKRESIISEITTTDAAIAFHKEMTKTLEMNASDLENTYLSVADQIKTHVSDMVNLIKI